MSPALTSRRRRLVVQTTDQAIPNRALDEIPMRTGPVLFEPGVGDTSFQRNGAANHDTNRAVRSRLHRNSDADGSATEFLCAQLNGGVTTQSIHIVRPKGVSMPKHDCDQSAGIRHWESSSGQCSSHGNVDRLAVIAWSRSKSHDADSDVTSPSTHGHLAYREIIA